MYEGHVAIIACIRAWKLCNSGQSAHRVPIQSYFGSASTFQKGKMSFSLFFSRFVTSETLFDLLLKSSLHTHKHNTNTHTHTRAHAHREIWDTQTHARIHLPALIQIYCTYRYTTLHIQYQQSTIELTFFQVSVTHQRQPKPLHHHGTTPAIPRRPSPRVWADF